LPDNLWCLAGPSTAQTQRLTDTQSALRKFPQHKTQGFAIDLQCKFLRGTKIPHAVCENTTRVSPRKGQLLKECAKNAQLGARAWRKSDTVATCLEEKPTTLGLDGNVRIGATGGPPAFGKTILGAGGNCLDKRRGSVKIPHGHAVSTLEKSATLLSLAPSTRRISGQASRAVPG
jgi:hypothetical protein